MGITGRRERESSIHDVKEIRKIKTYVEKI